MEVPPFFKTTTKWFYIQKISKEENYENQSLADTDIHSVAENNDDDENNNFEASAMVHEGIQFISACILYVSMLVSSHKIPIAFSNAVMLHYYLGMS